MKNFLQEPPSLLKELFTVFWGETPHGICNPILNKINSQRFYQPLAMASSCALRINLGEVLGVVRGGKCLPLGPPPASF
jgi:hypothetical protein